MTRRKVIVLIAGVLCLLMVTVGLAAPNQFALRWWTVDGGGEASSAPGFTLASTIGQIDVSPEMTGGNYVLVGGFREGALPPPTGTLVFLPLVAK